jgi:hypothetical protein
MFFDRRYERGADWYASYFDDKFKKCGEVAPTYFDVPKVSNRLYRFSRNCEIIVNLRHPAERAFSLYRHHLKKGRVSRPLRKAVEDMPRIISAGKYATHLPRWQSAFGREQVHLLFISDIKNRPESVVNKVCDWIGVESEVLQNAPCLDERVNTASMPRSLRLARGVSSVVSFLHAQGLHSLVSLGKKVGLKRMIFTGGEDQMPKMAAEDRSWLIQEYEEDISYIESETNRDLSGWRV